MAQYRYFRLVGAICLVLNGVTLIAICTGWKIWGIIFERRRPLLGCSGTATGLSILQLLAACVYHPEQTSAIFWILARLCSVLEALVLSAVLALLYVSTSATDCFHGGGRVNFCRVTVNTKQFLSCLMLADPLPVYHHEYNGNGTYIIVLYGDSSTSRKEWCQSSSGRPASVQSHLLNVKWRFNSRKSMGYMGRVTRQKQSAGDVRMYIVSYLDNSEQTAVCRTPTIGAILTSRKNRETYHFSDLYS